MQVALIYPEVYDMARFKEARKEFPPFGVLYLAASLREANHEVAIHKVNAASPQLDLREYDAIGFSLASSATYGLLWRARREALVRRDALIMVGGVHANFYPRESLLDFEADVVSFGESDETILRIVEQAKQRRFHAIPSVMWRQPDGAIASTTLHKVGRDISHLPLPARDLLDPADFVMSDRLAGRDLRMAHVMFSRGCPFPCSFCAAGQTRIQYRNGRSARHELEHLIDEYGIEGFAIVDDNFIVAQAQVRDICHSITDLGMQWSALSRVDTVNESLLADMRAAGCIEVKFGVESGSEQLLRKMRKNTTQKQIMAAVQGAKRAGIEAKAFIIHGYPGENSQTTEETMRLLDDLGDDLARVSLFRFVPLPGTQVYGDTLGAYPIHGTHLRPDWDGDWEKFHIHHNNRHWWGSTDDFAEMDAAYQQLERHVEERWGRQR